MTPNTNFYHYPVNKGMTMGLDVGVRFIGFAVAFENLLMYYATHDINGAEGCKNMAAYRHSRRKYNRLAFRLFCLNERLFEGRIISEEESKNPEYLKYEPTKGRFENLAYMRNYGLKNELTEQEIAMVLYNWCSFRGHFLSEDIDFEHGDGLSAANLKEYFEIAFNKAEISFKDPSSLDTIVEHFVKFGRYDKDDAKELKKAELGLTKEDNVKIENATALLSNRSSKVFTLDPTTEFEKTITLKELFAASVLTDTLESFADLASILETVKLLQDKEYISDYYVEKCEQRKEIIALYSSDPAEAKKLMKEYFPIQADNAEVKLNPKKIKAFRNNENNFPNGLHIKELRVFLKTQQKFHSKITDKLIDDIIAVFKMKIPYWVGPLDENATNAWVVKKEDFKGKSFAEYGMEAIDIEKTLANFRLSRIGRCTYLHDELVLPKCSWLGETFMILNTLNVLTALKDGEEYVLTTEDKDRILTELFAKKETVRYYDVKKLLDLDYFGTSNGDEKSKFNNGYTLYRTLIRVIPKLTVKKPSEDFKNVSELEEVLVNMALFSEKQVKINYLIEHFPELDIASIKRLAKNKAEGFYKISKKLISELVINTKGEVMLDVMFKTNKEQMAIITEATNVFGTPLGLDANPYKQYFSQHPVLNGDVFYDEAGNKRVPSMPAPVIHACANMFKDINEFAKREGYFPGRIIIEAAREFGTIDDKDPYYKLKNKSVTACYRYVKSHYGGNMLGPLEDVLKIKDSMVQMAYIQQAGIDLYDGRRIDLGNIRAYELDHALSRRYGINCLDNRILTKYPLNRDKGDATPIQAIRKNMVIEGEGSSGFDTQIAWVSEKEYRERVFKLRDNGIITANKVKFLLLEDTSDRDGFIGSNLTDTRYMTRELVKALNAYFEVMDVDVEVITMNAGLNLEIKHALGIHKRRGLGEQHHAMDAGMLIVADKLLRKCSPFYDKHKAFGKYDKIIKGLKERRRDYDFKDMIKKAYKDAFGSEYNSTDTFLYKLKDTTPSFMINRIRKPSGSWCADQYVSAVGSSTELIKMNELLGCNNGKSLRTGFKTHAMDVFISENGEPVCVPILSAFYRKGKLNYKRYADFIKEYVKAPELLDENGNVRLELLKHRYYSGDIVIPEGETEPRILRFNSVIKHKNAYDYFNIKSYNEVEALRNEIRKKVEKKFNIEPYRECDRKPGVVYRKYEDNPEEIIEYIAYELLEVEEGVKQVDERRKFAFDEIKRVALPTKGNKEHKVMISAMYDKATKCQFRISDRVVSNKFLNSPCITMNNTAYLSKPKNAWCSKLL